MGRSISISEYLVWGVWALMVAGAIIFVVTYGRDVPYWDDWYMVPVLVGDQSINGEWLWLEHNGHRIPLPRLILVALYSLSGNDFRVGMYFNVLALTVVSFAMIWVAKVKRGRQTLSDAFFPLVMLNWGHYENLLWSWQVTQVVPVVIVSMLLLIMLVDGWHLSFPLAIAAGVLVLLLPMCGFVGLAYVPAFVLWLTLVALTFASSAAPRSTYRSWIVVGFAVAAVAEIGLYFVGYQGKLLIPFSLQESLRTSMQFLTGGFGPSVEQFWPYLCWAMVFLLLFTVVELSVEIWRKGLLDASHSVSLMCFFLAVGTLALSVGVGRQGYGFVPRYFLIAAPCLCCLYFAGLSLDRSVFSSTVRVLLFVLVVFFAPINTLAGLDYGKDYGNRMEAFRLDLLTGTPVSALVARHAPALFPCPFSRERTWGINVEENKSTAHFPPKMTCVAFHTWLEKLLRALQGQHISYFAYLEGGTDFREVPLPMNGLTMKSNGAILFNEPILLYGLRVSFKGEIETASRPACLQIFLENQEANVLFRRATLYSLLAAAATTTNGVDL